MKEQRMKRLRIGLDVDGVLADFITPYYELARKHNPGVVFDDSTWHQGLTKEMESPIWDDIRKTGDFWLSLKPLPGANILTFSQYDHTLIFVTNRIPTESPKSVERQTAEWLQNYFGIEFPTVIVAGHWYDKKDMYELLRLDGYIDDKPETIERMYKKTNTYAYDQPWNRSVVGAKRVKTVNEYIETLENSVGEEIAKG